MLHAVVHPTYLYTRTHTHTQKHTNTIGEPRYKWNKIPSKFMVFFYTVRRELVERDGKTTNTCIYLVCEQIKCTETESWMLGFSSFLFLRINCLVALVRVPEKKFHLKSTTIFIVVCDLSHMHGTPNIQQPTASIPSQHFWNVWRFCWRQNENV